MENPSSIPFGSINPSARIVNKLNLRFLLKIIKKHAMFSIKHFKIKSYGFTKKAVLKPLDIFVYWFNMIAAFLIVLCCQYRSKKHFVSLKRRFCSFERDTAGLL
jgi:hypothetical protein